MTQTDSKTPQADQLPGGRLMKAIVFTQYGPPDVLQLTEVAIPTPRDHEVLIRIYATTVTTADCELRSLQSAVVTASHPTLSGSYQAKKHHPGTGARRRN